MVVLSRGIKFLVVNIFKACVSLVNIGMHNMMNGVKEVVKLGVLVDAKNTNTKRRVNRCHIYTKTIWLVILKQRKSEKSWLKDGRIRMNKNYIAEFMKDNGLEVGEEFSIHDSSGFDNCFFCKDYSLSIASEDSFLDGETVLIELLTGQINPIKIKRQEYVEVTNDVPRFTEIEVRDNDNREWIEATFIFKTEPENDKYCYGVLDEGERGLRYFAQARMLKPSEPEFKEVWCDKL